MSMIRRIFVLAISAVWASSCAGHSSRATEHDLGQFQPGQPIQVKIEVTNPYDKPAMVTGLSDACGVRVVNQSNGVIPAKESMGIDLLANASRMPGECGFKLDLTIESEGKRSTFVHLFNYNVPSYPTVSRMQVWPGTAADSFDVLGVNDSASFTVTTPDDVRASVQGNHVVFSETTPTNRKRSICFVSVNSGKGKIDPIQIEVIHGASSTAPRVYPESLWLTGDSQRIELSNVSHRMHPVVSPPGAVKVVKGDGYAVLRRQPGFSGPGSVSFVNEFGKQIAYCVFWVPSENS